MKTGKMKTIGRLIEMRRKNVEQAEMAHAAAHATAVAAERARIEADRRWLAALDAADHIGLVADLEYRDMQLRALRRGVDQAEQQFKLAGAREAERRERMTDARVELRRFETWLERSEQEQRTERLRIERIAEDEVAARKQRAG